MTLHSQGFEPGRAPDLTVPSAARMYDYFLGGKNVVYVDSDPMVASHGRAMCDTTTGVTFVEHDIRCPKDILSDGKLTGLIDISAPIAVLAVSVLHFVPVADKPGKILAAFRSSMAPGSYLVLSHATSDGADKRVLSEIASVYKASTVPAVPRTGADIKGFFTGFELIEPGLVDMSRWRSDIRVRPIKIRFLAGVGRKPRELPGPVTSQGGIAVPLPWVAGGRTGPLALPSV